MADIKPFIKPDPEVQGASPAVGAFEDDIYEDAGDLEFNKSADHQAVFLARIPKELWEAWSHLDDDAEIQIGTIRSEFYQDGERPDGQKVEPSLLFVL